MIVGQEYLGFMVFYDPDIKMKKAEELEQARPMACTKESVYAWFDESEQFKIENNITSEVF